MPRRGAGGARDFATQRPLCIVWQEDTALTWKLERSAWLLTACWARFWDPLYYHRTYSEGRDEPAGYRSVEMELKRALASPADFLDMPRGARGFLRKPPASSAIV